MRLQVGGNVGIGTTNPAAKLDVAGVIRATDLCDETGTICKDLSASWGGDIDAVYTTAGTGLLGGFTSGSGTLSIDVGTTAGKIVQMAASDKLPAVDGSNLTNLNIAGSNGFVQNGNSFGAAAVLGTNDGNALSFETNNVTAMTIDANGEIGIGTTNAAYPLEVSNDTVPTIYLHNTTGNLYPEVLIENYGNGIPFFTLRTAKGTKASPTQTTNGTWMGGISFGGHSGSAFVSDVTGVGNAAILASAAGNFTAGSAPTNLAFYTTGVGTTASAARMTIDSTGRVGVGTAVPAASALLDVVSTTRGFLPPRMTTAQRTAIASPAEGLIVFDTDVKKPYIYQNAAWAKIADATEVAFRTVRGSAQSIPDSTFTTIDWTIETFDTANAFDLTTDRFSPSVAGYYLISYTGRIDAVVGQGTQQHIYKNGVPQSYCSADEASPTCTTSTVVYLNGAGDYVTALAYQASGAAANLNFGFSSMSGFLISGGTGAGGGADHLGNHTLSQNLVTGANWISSDGDPEGIRVDASGNVGVGSSAPTSKLDVAGTVTATAFVGPVTSSLVSAGAGTVGAPSHTFSGDPNTGFYSSAADTIGIAANGTNIFNLSSAGIVSPTAGGGSVTSGNGTSGAPTFSFAGDTDTGWWRPAADTMAASTNAVERMRIDANGNVGIGTTVPINHLDLSSASTAWTSIGLKNVDAGGRNYSVGSTGSTATIGAGKLSFFDNTAGLHRMTIDSAGYIGIGTAAPSQKLEVIGTALTKDASGNYVSVGGGLAAGNKGLQIYYDNTNDAGQIQSVHQGTGYKPLLLNTGGGNVGIGTTVTPSLLTIAKDYGPAAWTEMVTYNTSLTGASAGYNGYASNTVTVTNSITGAGGSDAVGYASNMRTADDAGDSQVVYGYQANLRTHPGDTAYGIQIADTNTSTGGTQYGIYLELDDTDVTRYGIYQQSANNNYFAGNVGIATTSPAGNLHVAKAGGFADVFFGDVNNTATGGLNGLRLQAYSDGNNYVDSKTFAAGKTYFRTGQGTEAGYARVWMAVDSTNGNVGIGTASPNALLTVEGAMTLDQIGADPAGTAGYGSIYAKTDGKLYFRNGVGTVTELTADASVTPAILAGFPDKLICTEGSEIGVYELYWYNATQVYYRHGDGNYVSTSFLRYNRSTGAFEASFDTHASFDATDCETSIAANISAGRGKFFGNNIGAVARDADDDTKVMVEKSPDEDKIRFDTAGSERMIIDNTGKVGIGTTAPTYIMQVASPSGASNNAIFTTNDFSASGNTGSSLRMRFGATTGNTYSVLEAMSSGHSGTNNLVLNPAGGNVGIGTSTPTNLLTLHASLNTGLNINQNGGTIQGFLGPSGFGGFAIGAQSNDNVILFSNNSERMRIASGGNVGIGTTSPSDKLHVVDANAVVGNPTIIVEGATSGYGAGMEAGAPLAGGSYKSMGKIVWDGENTWNTTASLQDSYMTIHTTLDGTTSEKFRITSAGNVGIGTTNPTTMLEVNGNSTGSIRINGPSGTGYAGLELMEAGSTRWMMYNGGVDDRIYIGDGDNSNGVYMSQNAGGWTNYSDARLKENVRDYSVLDRIDRFRAVTFDWKKSKDHSVGVIAQEVYEAFPEVVDKGDDDPNREIASINEKGVWGVHYDQLAPLALQGVKELYALIRNLWKDSEAKERRIQGLEKENAELKERLERLEKAVYSKDVEGSTRNR